MDTRALLGERFREQCASADGDKANVYPYFIGVFDTVAALGSWRTFLLFTFVFLLAAAAVGLVGSYLANFSGAPLIGPLLTLLSFKHVFFGIVGAATLAAFCVFVYTHVKFDFHIPGYTRGQSLRTFHVTEIWQSFYDYNLNENVGYAKHAISIDEDRKDFARVPWGRKDEKLKVARRARQPVVRAGVVSRRARRSRWRLSRERVAPVGRGAALDARPCDGDPGWHRCTSASVLMPFPRSDGMQHDEVKAGFGLATRLFGRTWG